jgi:altronate dehydratase
MASSETDRRILILSEADNVGVAVADLDSGQTLTIGGRAVALAAKLPFGHKVALRDISAGEKIFKYGAPIGSATCAIKLGEHVHTHNLKSDYLPTFTLEKEHRYLKE